MTASTSSSAAAARRLAKLWYQSQAACIDRIEEHQKKLEHHVRLPAARWPPVSCARHRSEACSTRSIEATRKVGMRVLREKGVPFAGQEKTPSLRYPDQATFHPLKYLAGLASAIREAGGRFYAETIVESVEEDGNGVTVKSRQAYRQRAPCRGRDQLAHQ